MEIVVKKSALFNLLKNTLNEDAAARSDMFLQPQNMVSFEEENPIEAAPHMSLQLSEEEPPVADPEFVPGSIRELSLASMVIMKEVPSNQIEFVYRFLHKLLDMALDREEDEQGEGTKNLLEESPRAQELIKQAADLYIQGGDYLSLISQIQDADESLDADDIEDKISDVAFSIMSAGESQEQPEKPKSQSLTTATGQQVIRRPAKKKASEVESEPIMSSEYEVEDLRYYDKALYDKASNKSEFMTGYNQGADDAANDLPIADTKLQSVDYATGYNSGYEEILKDDSLGAIEVSDESAEDLEARLDKRNKFSENVPKLLRLIPEFYLICKEIGYKLETDRYNLMMTGDDPKAADKNIRQVFGISHTQTFIDHNLLKPYFFAKDFAIESAKKHFDVIFDEMYRTPAIEQFKSGFMEAIKDDNMSVEEGRALLIKVFVEKIFEDVANYNYEPDKDKKLQALLRTEFASTTVYKTGPAAGPGGSQKSSAKPYQGNTSATFHRRVKEEFRPDIIEDFLDRLTTKYLKSVLDQETEKYIDVYRIPTGRKDPNNPKKSEYFDFDPLEFKESAELYANQSIDKALKDQQDVAQGKVLVPEDEIEPEEVILGDEDSPDAMSDEEVAEKLSNTKDFQTLAPFFGFSGAPGMRQWFLKFAKRFFEMGLISSKVGDRTLIKFHAEMVEAVLESLSEGLPELLSGMTADENSEEKDQELFSVLSRASAQIEDAFQEFLDVGDDLHSISVNARKEDGTQFQIPFLGSIGGQLTRTINGMFFKKVLTKLDKSWTDYVADQLQTNKQFSNYISQSIAKVAKIDEKAARSVAEYFTGKKNPPEIVKTKSGKLAYKSSVQGNPTKGVKNLLKFGVDAEAYKMIEAESKDWFEDMLMTDFAKVMSDGKAFEGQYRELILKDYDKMKSDPNNFKKIVLQALDDVIVGSSQRMALSALQDYEVES